MSLKNYKQINKLFLTYCQNSAISKALVSELISGFRLVNTKCMTLVDMWKKMYHPNIVQLREVFTTKAFGDHCKLTLQDKLQPL